MPWRETGAMDLRLQFVAEHLAGDVTMTELCEAYGISRRVGYKWLVRYAAEGPAGLADRSHAPLKHGRETPAELVEKIVDLRRARPSWGPRKLVAKLTQLHPELNWPSHSTAHELLKRAGLVSARRVRRRPPRRLGELILPERPNHLWAVDHKGWVKLGDGQRCEPLTVADSYSRFLLALSAAGGVSGAESKPVLERAFREYGLPEAIRSDNGPPFASASPTGLSALSVWWIKLGIQPERITPGRPQENGRLERFHRTLLEVMSPPATDRVEQLRRFDAFRRDYNEERPHQALQQLTPASFYAPSPRPMPDRLPQPQYPSAFSVRRVRSNGQIKWRGGLIGLSTALVGEPVALEEVEHGWCVWFYRQAIGLIRPGHPIVLPIQPG
jgi:putative transposase